MNVNIIAVVSLGEMNGQHDLEKESERSILVGKI